MAVRAWESPRHRGAAGLFPRGPKQGMARTTKGWSMGCACSGPVPILSSYPQSASTFWQQFHHLVKNRERRPLDSVLARLPAQMRKLIAIPDRARSLIRLRPWFPLGGGSSIDVFPSGVRRDSTMPCGCAPHPRGSMVAAPSRPALHRDHGKTLGYESRRIIVQLIS
jgi:hypothetical protein